MEAQLAAGHDVGVREPRMGERFAVQLNALHVQVLIRVVLGDHRERRSLGRIAQRRPVHERAAEHVDARHRVHRIEAQRSEDEPGGYLPAIVVAGHALRRVVVKPRNLPHALLRLPRRAGEVVQIRDVVAGLVALRVLTDHAGDVGRRLENV